MGNYLNWYDYPAIHAKAGEIMKHRKQLKRSAVAAYEKWFDERCAVSKAQYEEAQKIIPGGIEHNLANNHPFPISIIRADGPWLYDADGNKYIDLLMAGGPTILGNNYLKQECADFILEQGPLTGLYSDHERLLAKTIQKHMPNIEMFRMLGSGTEADIIGIRLARAYTKKTELIRIRGGYHGWSDQLIYNAVEAPNGQACLNGIPVDCFKSTHCVEPNDIEDLERQFAENEKQGGTAALILEPLGQDSGAVPLTPEYHKEAEKLCRKYNALLIYDEVVTAFRIGMGGAQALFGTHPDLTIFGKIIGGGFGCSGGIGGRQAIISMLAAGINKDRSQKVRVGGTLSANPLTAFAGRRTIEELERLGAHKIMADAADRLMKEIGALTDKYQIPALVFNHQSILHIDVAASQHIPTFYKPSDPEYARQTAEASRCVMEFAMALAAEGLIISGGGKTYLCYETASMIDDILDVYDRVFRQFE